jgi:hypothetical protein
MEDIDRARKSNNVEEDKTNINNHERHRMPPATSSIKANYFKRCCPFMHKRILT